MDIFPEIASRIATLARQAHAGLLVDLIANEMRVYKREAAIALDQK